VRSSVRRSLVAALFLSLGLVAGGSSTAIAATTNANVFVVPSGGSSSCSRQATPVTLAAAPASAKCSTMQAAVSAMSGGDTGIVTSGTYANANISGVTKSPAVTLKVEAGGTANVGGTTWVGANGVTLDGTEGANGQGFSTSSGFTVGSNGGAALKNFKITGALIHDAGGGAVVYMTGCDNVVIQHLEIKNINGADGIQMANFTGQPWCTNVTFDDIYMHDFNATCGVDHQDGVQIRSGANITFTNSRIIKLNNCGSQGFFANQEGDLGGNNTTLSNTVIAGINGNAINFSSKPPQRMLNNTIDGGLNTCQPVTSTCNGVIMKNNILNTSCGGLALYHNRVQNSADWANNVTSSNCGYSSQGDTVAPSFSAMFTAPGSPSYDYHLKAGAFAIGKATTAEYTPTDFDFLPRDSAPDAGADEYGNGGATPPPADTTAPTTTITSAPGDSTSTSASIAFTGSDETTATGSLGYECALDGGAYASCTSPKAYSGLAAGDHTFSVRAKDAAGNVDASPATATWTISATPPPVDTTDPDTSITAAPTDGTSATTASFSFAGTDDTTAAGSLTFECSLDGAVFSACTSPKSYTGLAVGDHTFAVRAMDAAGNVDASPAGHAWTITAPAPVDTTAPTTTITSAPSGSTTSTSASIAFTGTDNVTPAGSLTFQCKIDSGAYAACTSPKAFSGLAVGSHTVSVRAKDAAGNTGAADSATWTVASTPPADTTAPNTTISSSPQDGTTDTTGTFAFTGTDDTTPSGSLTFQCSLDNAAYATCTSPKSYTNLSVGTHNVRIRAKDAAGNVDPSAASRSWAIAAPDATAPATTITGAPSALTLSSDATFAFTGTDDRSAAAALTFECRLDGGAWTACTSPVSYSGLALLGHTFGVRAIDEAGNADTSPATATWTVLAPTLPEITPTDPVTDPIPPVTDPVPPVTDPVPPVVAPAPTTVVFTAPAAGSTFGKTLSAGATAVPTQGASIRRVDFYLDGTRIARDTGAPYKASWSVPSRLAAGAHTLSARAFDSKNAVVSTAITVLHTTATATRAAVKRQAGNGGAVQLSSTPAADGGTDLAGAAISTSSVTATLASCSGKTAKHTKKVTLRAVSSQLSGHQGGRYCVIGLAPAASPSAPTTAS
jgi:hypothetical protein